jgi:hypothetical protein
MDGDQGANEIADLATFSVLCFLARVECELCVPRRDAFEAAMPHLRAAIAAAPLDHMLNQYAGIVYTSSL